MSSVSVVIPNYNGKHLLEKHLPSVLSSMRSGDELLIIDDASTDDS
jgi:glycosyltransferase involved in cell wall biosynthesis